MPGRATATILGNGLRDRVADVARALGLHMRLEAGMGTSITGRRRRVDLLVWDDSRKQLGIEVKSQDVAGTAEEKLVATLEDFKARPIPHILVFSGGGFSQGMRAYLLASGKAVPLEDLEEWLCAYFAILPDDAS